MFIIGIIILVLIAASVFLIISIYNGLVAKRNQYKNSYAQIDVQLKRRYDLIPNLVESAKAYLSHERETLEAVIQARNQAVSASEKAKQNPGEPGAMTGLMQAEGILGGALGRLFAVSEAYPDLKANQTIAALMEELTTTENKISFARQAFNDMVMVYNIAREKFPNNLIASSFNFQQAQLLEPVEAEEERQAPKVSFS